MAFINGCQCEECMKLPVGVSHWSDCAVHSEPAYPRGECDCGTVTEEEAKEKWNRYLANPSSCGTESGD